MRIKILLATMTAALLLTMGAGMASANRSISVGATRIEGIAPRLTFESSLANVICDVTRLITLHARLFPKVIGTLIGNVTDVRTSNCSSNPTDALRETLPWNIRYNGFDGTLPGINGIRVQVAGANFFVTLIGVRCLYTGTGEGTINIAGGVARTITFNEAIRFRNTNGGLCPATGRLRGVLTLSPTVPIALH